MQTVRHEGKLYSVKVVQRRKPRQWQKLAQTSFTIWLAIVGGLSGSIIAALVINRYIAPGHPFYVGLREWLQSVFGGS